MFLWILIFDKKWWLLESELKFSYECNFVCIIGVLILINVNILVELYFYVLLYVYIYKKNSNVILKIFFIIYMNFVN